MASYYVNNNAQPASGDHEVHVDGCIWLSLTTQKTYLGEFLTCQPAVAQAKTIYRDSNGCFTCCRPCHTT